MQALIHTHGHPQKHTHSHSHSHTHTHTHTHTHQPPLYVEPIGGSTEGIAVGERGSVRQQGVSGELQAPVAPVNDLLVVSGASVHGVLPPSSPLGSSVRYKSRLVKHSFNGGAEQGQQCIFKSELSVNAVNSSIGLLRSCRQHPGLDAISDTTLTNLKSTHFRFT